MQQTMPTPPEKPTISILEFQREFREIATAFFNAFDQYMSNIGKHTIPQATFQRHCDKLHSGLVQLCDLLTNEQKRSLNPNFAGQIKSLRNEILQKTSENYKDQFAASENESSN